jgi:hypothetical protein
MTPNAAAACLSSHSVAKNLAPNCHNNKEALGKHSSCCKFNIAYTGSFFSFFFFFFGPQFCDVATLVIMHKEELAKIGYRSERKAEKIKNLAIF